jgi:GNAT superfamily N-acetyltransferase
MPISTATLLDEANCSKLEEFLADRIHEFNTEATGYFDGRLLGACIRDEAGQVVAGLSGHTWGGCCEISYLWVSARHRANGLGAALLQAAEAEAVLRGCSLVVLMTHSFQAPRFYERFGYQRTYAIEGRPRGHSNIVFTKSLQSKAAC